MVWDSTRAGWPCSRGEVEVLDKVLSGGPFQPPPFAGLWGFPSGDKVAVLLLRQASEQLSHGTLLAPSEEAARVPLHHLLRCPAPGPRAQGQQAGDKQKPSPARTYEAPIAPLGHLPTILSMVYGLVLTETKLNLYAATPCYCRSFSQSPLSLQSIFQEKDLDF